MTMDTLEHARTMQTRLTNVMLRESKTGHKNIHVWSMSLKLKNRYNSAVVSGTREDGKVEGLGVGILPSPHWVESMRIAI